MSIIDRAVDRVKMMLVKALVKSVTDTGQIQLVKLSGLSGENQDGVERIQNYGLTSNPPPESEAIVAYLNGNRDHGVVVVCDSGTFRVTGLLTGEVSVYSQYGQQILLKSDGSVEITAPAGMSVGAGSDAVAMAAKTDAIPDTIATASTGQVCATPGATCPLSTSLVTAMTALASTASTNVRAD